MNNLHLATKLVFYKTNSKNLIVKFLLLLFTFIFFASFTQPHVYQDFYKINAKGVTYVYVCYSKTLYAYHSTKDCRGLNRCTHEIIKITESDAINTYYKRACKECW